MEEEQTKTNTPEKLPVNPKPPEVQPAAEKPKEELKFFNIMPQQEGKPVLVSPVLKMEETKKPSTEETSPSFFAKYKKIIIITIICIILGIGGYVAINMFAGIEPETDIVLKKPIVNNNTANKPNENTQEGFTTTSEWREKYFPNCSDATLCGDSADPDHDGLENSQEFNLSTDPNNADSDQDGLSDGDEINIFSSNPLNTHTANDPQYTDADFVKGAYDFGTGKKMSTTQINSITIKMNALGLHQPTVKTLFGVLNSVYNFNATTEQPIQTTTSTPTTVDTSAFDQSVEAKQDRDAQRSNTIKNIESALVKYEQDNGNYPISSDFGTMFALIKPYLKVATNPTDPINSDPFIYAYVSDKQGADFTLSFYSELATQTIKKHSQEAINDTNSEQAAALDDQRQYDLESIRTALLLYSQKNVAGNQTYVFPSEESYKTSLVPDNISQIPKDPRTHADYEYKVSTTFDTFTLKAILDKPSAGTTGWLCNQEECRSY